MRFFLFFLPILLFAEAHIFVLHRINDSKHPYTNTSTKELEKYLSYIKKHNYKAVKLSTLVKKIEKKENIDKYVVFTIDDNYKSFYKNGLPLFKKYHIPFTLFVYTQATEGKWGDFMTWNMVKECSKYGELGVHSYAHPHLPKLSNKEIKEDTLKAIKLFKKRIGYVPDMYAYPYGEYDNRVKKIISKYFKIIANQNPGAIDLTTPIDDLDRIALTGKVNIEEKLKLKRLHIKSLIIKREKNKIQKISGNIKEKIPYVNIYLTDFGWKYHIKVKNHKFSFYPDFKLKRFRNRVIIRYNYKIFSRMIIKY
jgi:peptidoglycan/xylan/chitin deacetylase (PgdA/CDA1 family)